jgi:hybrid cluster-associated redox disulfide protein
MAEAVKITKDMTFGEVLKKHPETVKTFFEHGMHCFGCHLSVTETIEQGAMAHGVDVNKLVEELNKTASSSSDESGETSSEG